MIYIKKTIVYIGIYVGLPLFYLLCQRSLKESCTVKLMRLCKINCQTNRFSSTLASARQVTSNKVNFILNSFNTESSYRIPTKFVKLLSFVLTSLVIAINNRLNLSMFPAVATPIDKNTDGKYVILDVFQ